LQGYLCFLEDVLDAEIEDAVRIRQKPKNKPSQNGWTTTLGLSF